MEVTYGGKHGLPETNELVDRVEIPHYLRMSDSHRSWFSLKSGIYPSSNTFEMSLFA